MVLLKAESSHPRQIFTENKIHNHKKQPYSTTVQKQVSAFDVYGKHYNRANHNGETVELTRSVVWILLFFKVHKMQVSMSAERTFELQ
jgi:hypothetical protein